MNQKTKFILFFTAALLLFGIHNANAALINAASCSQADVSAAIGSANHGDTINVPAGNCSWTNLSINNAVHLKGAGTGQTNIAVSGNTITKQSAGIIKITNFSFSASGGGNSHKGFDIEGSWLNAEPVIIEGNAFSVNDSGMFYLGVAGGVIIANNSFIGGWDDSFIQPKNDQDSGNSWGTADTMGDRDTQGKLNIYVEDNTFYGGTNQGIDCDDSVRCVYRYNNLTYSSFNTHGMATSPQGVRHFEVYENTFIHDQGTIQIANQNWLAWIRGGTGVIFNNKMTDIAGSYWGDKAEIKFTIRGAEDARPQGSCGNVSYPVPRQLGQNHNGSNYFTDPIYIWGNIGTQVISAGWNWGNPCGFNFSDFFQWGRDAVNTGTPKPGYAPYTYPHPLRLEQQEATCENCHFVRSDATGANDGSDWTNARTALPATLQRGATYYIADGTYEGYTFDDAVSGTSVITIKKATASDYGTDAGWNSSYGDGQAEFTSGLYFATDYWVIDGSARNESKWDDGPSYGIKTRSIGTNYFWYNHAADNVTIKYLDIGADYGFQDSDSYREGIYLGGFSEVVENWLIQRSYIHNVSLLGQHAGVHNVTYEYNFMGPSWSKSGIRHQGRGSSVTIRYNIFRNACQGHVSDPTTGYACTAIVGWYGNAGSNNENYANSAVYGNLFIDTVGGAFYSDATILMGDDRTSQGGGPSNCDGCKIFNNTFVGMGKNNSSGQIGFRFDGVKTNTEAKNNIFYDIGTKTPFCGAISCSNNVKITSGGIFVNPAGDNYKLVSNGVAGTGDPLFSPYNTDMDGNIRGADGVWDIGAYEYVSGAEPSCGDGTCNGSEDCSSCSDDCGACPRTYSLSDFIALLADWLTPGTVETDVNSDNIVNARDLGIIMSNWE